MQAAPISEIRSPFYHASVTTSQVFNRTKALQTIRRFLLDEIVYEEVDLALCWLEDEYPTARKKIMQLRCCLLLQEFVDYEEHISVCARHFLQLMRVLR